MTISRPSRVIVAGAGLAGLAAAHELASAGVSVTIVEARDRIGGRVFTVREGFAAGYHGELGGEFVDEDHRELRRLAQLLGVQLVPVLQAGFTQRFRTDGGELRVSRTMPWRALEKTLSSALRRYTATQEGQGGEVKALAAWSLREWLRAENAGAELHSIANGLRGFFLADPEELSVLPVVEQLAKGGSPAQKRLFRMVGGNGQFAERLLRSARASVLLRHRVRQIERTPHGVVVRMEDAAGATLPLDADAVVVTLPASTLRDVIVTPPLPETQTHAIRALKYGRATKVVVQVAGPGLTRRRAQAFATDTHLGAFWDSTEGLSLERPSEAPLSMITFLGGGVASDMLRRRLFAGPAYLLSDLCWLRLDAELGGFDVDAPVVRTQTWEDDPWAKGGYAFIDPAFDPDWRPLLSQRAGAVVFAGEHTSADHQGYMEGAVESGLRAARELLRSDPPG